MRRLIAQTFPAHGVIGEEYGRDRPDAEYVWVLDPIDGTKSFISGLPTWGTLIGLMHRGRPVYGMMAQPFTRERFYGDGKRAKLRTLALAHGEAPPSEWATRTLRTRVCGSLREATLTTTSPLLIRDDADRAAYFRVENEVRLARYGGDCYAYCALAAGFIDLVIETNLKPHDVVALDADHRGGGRRNFDLGRRGRRQGRPHHRRRRPGRLRRGASFAASRVALRQLRKSARRPTPSQGAKPSRRWRRTQIHADF